MVNFLLVMLGKAVGTWFFFIFVCVWNGPLCQPWDFDDISENVLFSIWFGAPAPPTTLGKSESQRGAPRVSSLNQLISRIKYYSPQTGLIDWAPIAVRIVRNQCFSNKMNWLSTDCRKNRAKSVFFEENELIGHCFREFCTKKTHFFWVT